MGHKRRHGTVFRADLQNNEPTLDREAAEAPQPAWPGLPEIEFWERTFDAMADPVAIMDTRHRIVWVNRSMADRLGITKDQCIGQACYSCVHGTDAPPPFCPHSQLLCDGKEHTAEVCERRLGGDFLVSASPLCDPAGRLAGSVHAAHDISDRKRAEEAITRSEALLKESQQVAGIGSWELDLATNVLTWSEEVYRIVGLEPHQFNATYEAFLECVHPDDRAVVDKAYSGSVAEGKDTYEIEHRVVRKTTGETRYVYEQCRHYRDAAGAIVRSIGTVYDITDRKQALLALEQESRKNLALLRNASDGIHILDTDGRIIEASDSFCRMLGYERDEVIGMHVSQWDAHFVEPELSAKVREQFERPTRSQFETKHRRKDGSVFDVEVSGYPLDLGGRKVLFNSSRDITERKEAEEKLRKSEEKYRELVEHANSIILHWTSDGCITFMNEYGQRFFGFSETEILGRHVVGTIVPETESTGRDLRPLMDHICADPEAFESNINENIKKSGDRVWIAWTNKVAFDDRGRITGILSIGTNITERKEAEQALSESEYRYRALADRLPLAVQVFSPDGFTLRVNEAWERLWQTPLSALKDYNVFKDRQLEQLGIMGQLEQAFAGRAVTFPDHTYDKQQTTEVTNSGGKLWLRAFAYPVLREGGRLLEVVVIQEDITERKEAEEKMHSQLSELRRWQDVMLDRETRVLDLKREVNELLTRLHEPLRYSSSPPREGGP